MMIQVSKFLEDYLQHVEASAIFGKDGSCDAHEFALGGARLSRSTNNLVPRPRA